MFIFFPTKKANFSLDNAKYLKSLPSSFRTFDTANQPPYNARMEKFIPEHIDPYRYADQALQVDGAVRISDMTRLSAALTSTEGRVMVHLHFGVDEQGITFLKGHLDATLSLQCQRCMEPLTCEIISDFVLGIVKNLDEENALPAHYEPAMAKEGSLALRELIEDEILLNLPIIPKHEPDQCKLKLPLVDSGWEEVKAKNPFRVLESLKDKEK
ncbi:MAG: hypothetical protein EPO11_02665 [Gammaproteobacteria bacterium]|nr:MAG: hypothetical protein EPO11_02665 [Gammaproteobacteria bacterium]